MSVTFGCQSEKVRNDHRFENLKKGHRSGVKMSDVEIEHGFKDWTSIRGWTSL